MLYAKWHSPRTRPGKLHAVVVVAQDSVTFGWRRVRRPHYGAACHPHDLRYRRGTDNPAAVTCRWCQQWMFRQCVLAEID